MHTLLTYTYVKCWGFLIVFCEAEETRTLGRQEQDRNVAIELPLVFSIKFPRGKSKTLASNSTMWVSKFGGRKRKSNNVCRNNTVQKEARKIGCHVFFSWDFWGVLVWVDISSWPCRNSRTRAQENWLSKLKNQRSKKSQVQEDSRRRRTIRYNACMCSAHI